MTASSGLRAAANIALGDRIERVYNRHTFHCLSVWSVRPTWETDSL
jgi:hypothetical protein